MSKFIVAELIYARDIPDDRDTVYKKDGDWYIEIGPTHFPVYFDDFSKAKDYACNYQGERNGAHDDIDELIIVVEEGSKKILYPNYIPDKFVPKT